MTGESEKLTKEPVLKGEELKTTLNGLAERREISPKNLNDFLALDPETTSRLPKIDKWIPGTLFAAYIATYALVKQEPPLLPAGPELPPVLHQLLQGVHNLSVNSASSSFLRDHLPYIMLELSVAWGGLKTLPEYLKVQKLGDRVKKQQGLAKEKVQSGEMEYKMAEGHTVAFVGMGDWLAERLQEAKPSDQVMLYAQTKLEGKQVWEKIKSPLRSELFAALERGNFASSGEVLLLPVKKEDMFLPGETGHDMTVDEIESIVAAFDDYCDSKSIKRKKIIIVGSRGMRQDYVERNRLGEEQRSSRTLADLEKKLKVERRGAETKIIDPTEEVIKQITRLGKGKEIIYKATSDSDTRYGERFFQAIKNSKYQASGEGKLRVHYNITDIPTEVTSEIEDIAVVLDPSIESSLISKGMRKENIIVVPNLVLEVVSAEVEKS